MLPLPHPNPPPADHEEIHTEFPDSEFLSIHKPINNKKNSLLEQEKQISIDPISLKESSPPHPPPPSTTIATTKAKFTALLPPLLPPTKTKFLSTSLPSSATSSPRFSSSLSSSSVLSKKKHWKINQIQPSPAASSVIDPLSRQHSVALSRLAQLQENHLRRSKSCGDGRATSPSDDFDRLWLNKVNKNGSVVLKIDHETMAKKDETMDAYDDDHRDEKFKCGALCLFLPGFGRGKPVRPRKDLENGNEFHRKEKKKGKEIITGVMSRTVSLEKFECGSWTSSAIIVDQNEDQDGDPTNNLFFDLPLELIRNEMNDADSPVTAAFVFDKQQVCGDRKGVLKKSRSSSSRGGGNCNNGRKSQESPSNRHVRFRSTSNNSSPRSQPTSPANSCISPRLRKAREDFNAFLEAQSA